MMLYLNATEVFNVKKCPQLRQKNKQNLRVLFISMFNIQMQVLRHTLKLGLAPDWRAWDEYPNIKKENTSLPLTEAV